MSDEPWVSPVHTTKATADVHEALADYVDALRQTLTESEEGMSDDLLADYINDLLTNVAWASSGEEAAEYIRGVLGYRLFQPRAEVAALAAQLARAETWEYFAGLAFAYFDAPDGTDDVDIAWHELSAAIKHYRATDGANPRDPDEIAAVDAYQATPATTEREGAGDGD